MTDDTRVEESKFDTGGNVPALEPGDLPWGYGDDRITAIVRDPESAYLYWEITDAAIADARSRLGPAGPQGWCNLRVYDTTGHEFDGTNANDYFDIGVDRTDREYFLMIRRPTSVMHAEIGIKTHEGFFQPIARTGRAEFPRNAPSPNTSLEWMTVTSDDTPPAARPFLSRYSGGEPPLPGRAGAGYVDVWRAAYAPSISADGGGIAAGGAPAHHDHASKSGAGIHRTVERSAHIERWWHLEEWRAEWRGGLRFTRWVGSAAELGGAVSWQEGPFPVELLDAGRVAVEFLEEAPVHLQAEGMGFTVYGPWRVTVRSYDAPQRRVLATWSVRWVRATTPMIERWGLSVEHQVISGFSTEKLIGGASEQGLVIESGASERWRIGASERMWAGASEWVAAGASETVFLGASQWGFAGASALLYRGASERIGASERWRMGASERLLGGASEWVGRREWAGGSETLGGSEWLGGSENLGASIGGSQWVGGSEHVGSTVPNASGHKENGGVFERWGGRLEEG